MLLKILLSLCVFAALLLATNFLHFRYFPVDVVLYSGLLDVLIATLIATYFSWRVVFKKHAAKELIALLSLVFVLCGYIYIITVPTIIDRSYSMYILEKIRQHDGRLHARAFDGAITEAFLHEHRLNDVRLTEQMESGTVRLKGDCVELTTRGKNIADFTHWYRTHMLPKKRLLMGEYSDDLTDPLGRGQKLQGFDCP